MASAKPYTFAVFDTVLHTILKEKKEAKNILKSLLEVIRKLKPNPKNRDVNNNSPVLLGDLVWKVRFELSGSSASRGARFFYCQPPGEKILPVVKVIFKSKQIELTPKEKQNLKKELEGLGIARKCEG